MTQELITDLDRVVLKRAAALLEEAGFRFSCSATVEVDHEAGRVLVLSALDVEQDRVGIGFQLSDALARMRSDVPIACRALSSRATRQIADVSQDFYRPEALAARVDVARWIGDEAVNRAVACAGLVSGDSQGVSDADWFGVFRPVQHPSIGRAEKLFLNFRSARALAVTSASLRRLVEAADPLDAAEIGRAHV